MENHLEGLNLGTLMRSVDLSEFSYGYALTEDIIYHSASGVQAAPFFPSLIKEGKKGGGYDVGISFTGYLLFLQFKLSDRMQRRSAIETKKGLLQPPFYRMHLRATSKSDQHAMLIDLESKGNRVFYAAPKFNTAQELDSAYLARRVGRNSCFFKPSHIGKLPDNHAHWVAFDPHGTTSYFCSTDPKKLKSGAMLSGDLFLEQISSWATESKVTEDTIRQTADEMDDVILRTFGAKLRKRERTQPQQLKKPRQAAKRREETEQEQLEELRGSLQKLSQERAPQERVAYLARSFFGCEVVRVKREG